MLTMGKRVPQRRVTTRPDGRAARLRREFAQAAADTKRLGAELGEARHRLYTLAAQLHGDGVSWRSLAVQAGLSHVALMDGVKRAVDAELARVGL